MSSVLSTTILGVKMKNPVIAASGTFGFGEEYNEIFDVSKLGGISGKGLTLNPSHGNKGIRLAETPSGLLNSIGLENVGVDCFVKTESVKMRSLGAAVIANLGGHSEEDYLIGAKKLNEADIDILELNISCPNVKTGGMAFGTNPKTAENLVSKVKNITRFPLLVKLTPNTADITEIARACENGGADGVSLVNTFLGMAIDIKAKKPVFNNIYAGLSGPAIMPIALRMVHQTAKSVKIPVVGMGGITTWKDALCFMMAGASAVQIGTANFIRPTAVLDIIDGLEKYCVENNLANISEIVGII